MRDITCMHAACTVWCMVELVGSILWCVVGPYYTYVVVDLTFSLISHCLVTHQYMGHIDRPHEDMIILIDDVMSLVCPVPLKVLQLAAPLAT